MILNLLISKVQPENGHIIKIADLLPEWNGGITSLHKNGLELTVKLKLIPFFPLRSNNG